MINKARIMAIIQPEVGSWLNALPSLWGLSRARTPYKLQIQYVFELKSIIHITSICDAIADPLGIYGLSCING